MNQTHPLFNYQLDQLIAWHRGKPITAGRFLDDVAHVTEHLPRATHAINLCDDRYHFMLGFAACLLRDLITLLPPNATPGVVNALGDDHPDCVILTDKSTEQFSLPQHLIIPSASEGTSQHTVPQIPHDRLVAILFTSGSTGKPTANRKVWGDLYKGAQLAADRFGIKADRVDSLVATVPPQHMYGLETSVLIPWFGGVAVHCGRPLFPADVRDALVAIEGPRVLITTPVHLRTCVAAELDWPEIDFLISATAPLSGTLAQAAEASLGTRVMEIYGSTETGSIASRRTVEGERWTLYEEMSLHRDDDRFFAQGPQLPEPVPLGDQLEILDQGGFKLLGRHSDMLKIAGKRASLGDLNHKLNEIEGVLDATFIIPEQTEGEVGRLTALVVAPGMSKEALLVALARSLDPVFLPRPLYLVDKLPRSSSGKLPRDAILKMLNDLKGAH